MDTSVTIIGLILTILLLIPLTIVFRSNLLNKSKIRAIKNKYSQNNTYNFEVSQIQNKKFLSIDQNKKGFLFIDFSYKKDTPYFVDLKKVLSSTIKITKQEDFDRIAKIEIELEYKNEIKKELIPIYNIDNHFLDFNCLHEDHTLAKKWTTLINDCIN